MKRLEQLEGTARPCACCGVPIEFAIWYVDNEDDDDPKHLFEVVVRHREAKVATYWKQWTTHADWKDELPNDLAQTLKETGCA